MGKLAQRTGASTENLSVFVREAELADATVGDVQQGLAGLSTNLEKLRRGEDGAIEGFRNLGLAAEDFTGLDTVEAAVKIGQSLAAIEDPARRAALAKETLGRAGIALIPTLLDLADKGFANATAEARKLGLVIDQDLANAAQAANDSFTVVKQQVQGLALQFVAGLAPAITQAMTTFSDETGGRGVESMQTFGRVTGRVIGLLVNLFRFLAGIAGTTFEIVGGAIATQAAAMTAALQGNFSEAVTIVKEGFTDIAAAADEGLKNAIADAQEIVRDLSEDPPKIEPRVRVQPDVDIEGGDELNTAAVRRAQLDAIKKRLEDELALQKAANDALLEENERAFEQGLLSLQQFTDRRREVLERQAAAEIAALEQQRAALAASTPQGTGSAAEAERLKIATELGSLDNDIRLRRLELARDLAEVEADQIEKAKKLGDEQRALSVTLAELEGRRHDAFTANLEDELQQVRELLTRAGQGAAEIEATLQRLSQARTARFDFEEQTRAGEAALEAFNRDAELIRRDAEAGITSQLEGERRLIELQRERLAVLEQLAAAALEAARATADPELIAQAQQYADSVAQIRVSFESAANAGRMLRNAGIDAFQAGLADLLANAHEIESLEDAFKSLARTVVGTLQQIAAELLARKFVLALLGGGTGGGGAGGFASLFGGAKRGGYLRGYAGGGTIGGDALPIAGPDKYPILAAKGEFMMRASRVREPGALAFLHAWNSGRFTLADAMRMPRYQTGGLIGAAPAAAEADPADDRGGRGGARDRLRIVNVLDDRVISDAMSSPAGEKVLVNFIQRNSSQIRSLLGGG
jgi:hypothetical protein